MHYKFASAKTEIELEAIVNKQISEGYEPHGFLAASSFVALEGVIIELFQTMRKR